MTGEQQFFQDGGVTVTSARFITNGQTHAMSGITSVKRYVQQPNRLVPGLLVLAGVGVLANHQVVLGLLLALLGTVLWIRQKALHSVVIRTAAGDNKALTDTRSDRVDSIIAALNSAIVHRG
jgi:Family of unknown function (DUF6232)